MTWYTDLSSAKYQRSWTEWINTDSPAGVFGDDDETLASIRKRGLQVCVGDKTISSVCRVVGQPGSTFNHKTVAALTNKLSISCTVKGLLCRARDQVAEVFSKPCTDYEIRFQCEKELEMAKASIHLQILAAAVGLVFLAVLCVVLMHLITARRASRALRAAHAMTGSQTRCRQPENTNFTRRSDLPPSYSQLFGETNSNSDTDSQQRRLNSRTRNVSKPTDMAYSESSVTFSSINTDMSSTDSSEEGVFSMSSGHIDINISPAAAMRSHYGDSSSDSPTSPVGGDRPSNRYAHACIDVYDLRETHIPGMHRSVIEQISPQRFTSSDDVREEHTPPPTYSEALKMLRNCRS